MSKRSMTEVAGMIVISGLTQVVALAKAALVAASFGAGTAFDGFNIALNVAALIFSLAGTGITVVLIPALSREDDRRAVDSFVTLVLSASVAIGIFVWLLRSVLLTVFSAGDAEIAAAAVDVFAILLISQVGVTVSGVTIAYFQCAGSFLIPKLVSFLTAFGLLAACLLDPNLTVVHYAWYTALFGVLNAAIQWIIASRRGFRMTFRMEWSSPACRSYLRLFVPTLISGSIYQLSLVFDTFLASSLGPGRVSVLSYSNSVVLMLNAVLAANLVVYVYPKLSRLSADDVLDARRHLARYCELLFLLMTGVVVLIFVSGEWSVSLLYERGQFARADTWEVTRCLLVSTIALPIAICRDVLYRFFYANRDTKSPFANSLVASAVNLLSSFLLSLQFGLLGIVWGTVIGTFVSLSQILVRYALRFNVPLRECLGMVASWSSFALFGFLAVLVGNAFASLVPSQAFGVVGGVCVAVLFLAGVSFVYYRVLRSRRIGS